MSHVPFLAVRPDDQLYADVTKSHRTPNMDDDHAADAPEAPYLPAMPVERLPTWFKFPVACLISFSLSVTAYTLTVDWAGFEELAAVSRTPLADEYIAFLVGWRIVSLGIGWYAGYDCTCEMTRRAVQGVCG